MSPLLILQFCSLNLEAVFKDIQGDFEACLSTIKKQDVGNWPLLKKTFLFNRE